MRPRLGNASLASVRGATLPGYDRAATRVGIVHIGPGAFFRAHQAFYVDALLHRDPRWAISAIALKSAGVRDALAPQDGLYVLNELGSEARFRVIGSIREVLVATENHAAVFERLTAPATQFVTMTVTEKGYCLNGNGALDESHPDIVHDWQAPQAARSLVGALTQALRLRRAAGTAPFVVICCDNLASNGPTLRRAVLDFSERLDRDLSRWIEDEVSFPRTMIDSITPATDDALRARVAEVTGVDDAWPIQREVFTQWVIEDLPAVHAADWASVGVTLAKDVSVYDRAKLRLLNGAHSTLAYVGLLRGHTTVLDAMNDATLAGCVERLMREDIAASLAPSPGLDVQGYIDDVLGRFRNPGIRHLLSQIAWDGSKKLPVRLLGTISDALQAQRSVERLALPIAAWMRFVVRQSKHGVDIVDPEAKRLAELGRACNEDPAHDTGLFLGLDTVFAKEIAVNPVFRRAIETVYRKLQTPLAPL
ncbi:MAG TPA: mannitol dehydrogenase family protein [Povalibacter sp.]|uniref:mannitol dehydrogenase family protein n=1 Tax=Povalibacter sp. TaxID=1962978 RepID=UPI002C7E2BFC|nr:mannitol dehydrogenase family protein [Povalibacter sp.]HMN46177.1 mannitol dehydrogenase family protein [Povalibacter sp.]